MIACLTFTGFLVIQASNILAEVPPPQPPRPVQAYPVQPATGAIIDPDTNAAKLAVLQQKQREREQLQKDIRQLQSDLGTIEQFSVRVQILEVSLTKLKNLATDFAYAGAAKLLKIQDAESLRQAIINSGTISLPTSPATGNSTSIGLVEWLKQNNIAKEIANPTLIVADGRPAKLFTGLEVPVPASATPTPANNYLRPGIEIDLAAFSRENNRVRIDIRGSVRELDEAHSIVANGAKIPAMKTRQFATGLEGAIGEPLVPPGLVEERTVTYKTNLGIRERIDEIALIAVVIPDRVVPPAQAVRTSVNNALR